MAVTTPFALTVAMLGCKLRHVTDLSFALRGSTSTSNVRDCRTSKVYAAGNILTLFTNILTLMAAVDVKLPSTVAAVMMAVPGLCAVTTPCESTVAIIGFDDSHVTRWSVALLGENIGVNVTVV